MINGLWRSAINLNFEHIACLKLYMNVKNMLCTIYPGASNPSVPSFGLVYSHYILRQVATLEPRKVKGSVITVNLVKSKVKFTFCFIVHFTMTYEKKIDRAPYYVGLPQDLEDGDIVKCLFDNHAYAISNYIHKAWNRRKRATYAQ